MSFSYQIKHMSVYNLISLKHFHHKIFISDSKTLKETSKSITKTANVLSSKCPLSLSSCRARSSNALSITSDDDHSPHQKSLKFQVMNNGNQDDNKNFWGAVSLIVGTAVGPGMLGLPSATIKSGPLPSTIAILLSWVYVVSSILLVAELSFASMKEDGVGEVSFTSLATKSLGGPIGALVAVIYASLSFALLVACVSGIGSIVTQWFPSINCVVAHALFPFIIGIVIGFFPFKAIDSANRLLCFIMLFSISALVATGLSVGRTSLLGSFTRASWSPYVILPAVPVAVLTLGFHVITPFVCKIVGKSVSDARKAILFGAAIPLMMVLSWNLVVLGLARTTSASPSQDPISLLLSVNASARPAVQGFAFSALATSLIGYAVSFPKQLVDTLELIWRGNNMKQIQLFPNSLNQGRTGRVGNAVYSRKQDLGNSGQVSFVGSRCVSDSGAIQTSNAINNLVMPLVLGAPIIIASLFPATFAKALDFAGVYANCFLFGILPPIMAWIHRSRKMFSRSSTSKYVSLLPGGDIALLLLFVVAVILAIWH